MSDCRVTRIALPICNVFLIQGTRSVLVDTGRPTDAARIESSLAQHGVRLSDISLFLHTHGHWDHCGSTAEFARKHSAPIAIHRADAELMRHGTNGDLKPTNLTSRVFFSLLNRPYPGVEPTLLLDGEYDLAPFGVAAKVVPTPGHTAGSISVVTAEGEVIVGDLFMGGYFGGRLLPRRPGYHYFADDLGLVRHSIQGLLNLKLRQFHVGHGGPLDPARVARWLGSAARRCFTTEAQPAKTTMQPQINTDQHR